MTQATYGSGNWTIEDLRERFAAPLICASARPADLKSADARCAQLIDNITWEKITAIQKAGVAKRKYEACRKSLTLSIAQQERPKSRDQKLSLGQIADTVDTYVGLYGGQEVNVPTLLEAMELSQEEMEIFDLLMKNVKSVAEESRAMAFNVSIEGKYGGSASGEPILSGPVERPYIHRTGDAKGDTQ